MATIFLTLKSSVELSLVISLIFASLRRINHPGLLKRSYWALFTAFFGSAFIAYGFFDSFLEKKVYDTFSQLLASLLLFLFFLWLWFSLKKNSEKSLKWSFLPVLAVITVFLAKGVEILLFPTKIFFQVSGVLNSEMILKITGGFLGIILAFFLGIALARVSLRLTARKFLLVTGIIFLIVILTQMVGVLQRLIILGMLPLTPGTFALLATLINQKALFFYALLFAALLFLIFAVFARQKEGTENAKLNPAQLRKIRATLRRERRRLIALGMMVLVVTLLVVAEAAMAKFASQELSPAMPIVANQGKIEVKTKEVSNGELHRFAYTTAEGIKMRFIVISKGPRAFGVGLDACPICGKTGYYQKGANVICKNCGSVINIATIGFPGGCNPIPLAYSLQKGRIVINLAELESQKDKFK